MDASSEALHIRGFEAVVAAVTLFNEAGQKPSAAHPVPAAPKGRGRSRSPRGSEGGSETVLQALKARCHVCHELISDAPPGVAIIGADPGGQASAQRFVHRDPCLAIRNLAAHGHRGVLITPGDQVKPFCPRAALRVLEDAVTALKRDGVGVQCEACSLVERVGTPGGPPTAACWRHGRGAGRGGLVAPVATPQPEAPEHPKGPAAG